MRRGAVIGLTVAGHPSVTCRTVDRYGEIEITVVTQANGVNYYATLTTTRATYDADLARFRRLLAGIRLTQPS